jgi:hypothetical protein
MNFGLTGKSDATSEHGYLGPYRIGWNRMTDMAAA